jgi:hypothetical protein
VTSREQKREQKTLPGFEDLLGATKEKRPPQPNFDKYRDIMWHEILHAPLNLRFRGRLHYWLEKISVESGFSLKEVLVDNHLRIVKLYLYPQEGVWLNQSEVMAMVDGNPKADLKTPLIYALIRVWRRERNGENALETLKFGPKDNLLYSNLLREGLKDLEDVVELVHDKEKLVKITATRSVFEDLSNKMHNIGYDDWNPEVKFASELPFGETSKR